MAPSYLPERSNICLCTALRNCTVLCNCVPKCKCCFCLSQGLYVSFFWKLALMHKDTCIGYKYKGHRSNSLFRRIGDRFGFHLKLVYGYWYTLQTTLPVSSISKRNCPCFTDVCTSSSELLSACRLSSGRSQA